VAKSLIRAKELVEMGIVVTKLGDDISTDIIYPGRYMATVLPSETPEFAFADDKEFNRRLIEGEIPAGSILLAGLNFGTGSSREQAASTLKGHDLIVVARSFARIFLQNAVNLGLQTVACPCIEAEPGDELEIGASRIVNRTSGKDFEISPLPAARMAIVKAGGLISYARQRLLAEQRAEDVPD
jgi:3-isopropylmalate/(R)-2-methylmalate dehydratase small subunit